jgi:iron complex transport system permease protein
MTIRISLLISLFFISLGVIAFSLLQGNTFISTQQLFAVFTGHGTPLSQQIVFFIRLPRTLSAFVIGGLLALAGALMQVLLRNPLADPYILGISGGAAITTLALLLLNVSGYWLTGGAWLGSLLSILILLVMTKTWNTQTLLLKGIAIASGFSALISLILLLSPEPILRGMLFWLVGDLSYAHLPLLESGILIVSLLISLTLAPELNILIRGEKEAIALGVNHRNIQLKLYLLSSLLTAAAVTLGGCIGFVGLIVPHLFRLLSGYDHRYLLPGSVLLGGILLTLANALSQTCCFPQELPVGIVMALIGIPIFLMLLQRKTAS